MESTGEGEAFIPTVLAVEPDTAEWGDRNDRWHQDLRTLQTSLEQALPRGTVQRPQPADGHMGVELTEVLVTLGSSGAVTAAVEVFKAWLGQRPKRRALVAHYNSGGEERRIVLDSENIESADVADFLRDFTKE